MSTAVVDSLAPQNPALALTAKTKNGKARAQALELLVQSEPDAMVNFQSNGLVLVVAEADIGLQAAQALKESGLAPVVLTPRPDKEPTVAEIAPDIDHVQASILQTDGHLGAFSVTVEHP
ncbi:MAG: hypothetical protein GWN87_17275, partial [Desulfuromonadales bacterium]|nr:hypothetical protein [Desulfuromonadales bacterium]